MRAGSKEYRTLLNIVKKYPGITSAEAISKLNRELRAENTVEEVLSLRAIAARYLNNLGVFGGV